MAETRDVTIELEALRRAFIGVQSIRTPWPYGAGVVSRARDEIEALRAERHNLRARLALLEGGERVEGWVEPYPGKSRTCYNFDPERRYVDSDATPASTAGRQRRERLDRSAAPGCGAGAGIEHHNCTGAGHV